MFDMFTGENRKGIDLGPYVIRAVTFAFINGVEESETDEDEFLELTPDDVRDEITQFGLGLGELEWWKVTCEEQMGDPTYIAWIPSKKVALSFYANECQTPGGIGAENVLRGILACIVHELTDTIETLEVEAEEHAQFGEIIA